MSTSTVPSHGSSEYESLEELISIGIDVGSSTTHVTLSILQLGRRASHFHRKTEVLGRKILYESPIRFTRFKSDDSIDLNAISELVEDSCVQAGVVRADIGAGVIICTGEAAKRDNARQITERLADTAGRFVCAAAGHHLEASLAAFGSGSVAFSTNVEGPVINLDIGGGTTKRALVRGGAIENTSAINIGARLLVADSQGVITWRAQAMDIIAEAAQVVVEVGTRLDEATAARLADTMAGLLIEFLGLAPLGPVAARLLVTAAPEPLKQSVVFSNPPRVTLSRFHLICSGGVSEFFYDRSLVETGDLGPLLAAAFRRKLRSLPGERIHYPSAGIRATVIGASNFTLQASGETVFVSRGELLPMKNIPVCVAAMNWATPDTSAFESSIQGILADADPGQEVAIYMGASVRVGYGKMIALAEAAARAMRGHDGAVAFVFGHNVANTFGRCLQRLAPEARFICVDEIEVDHMDFIDIGQPTGSYLPIVVKSLVFGPVQQEGQSAKIEGWPQAPLRI